MFLSGILLNRARDTYGCDSSYMGGKYSTHLSPFLLLTAKVY
jgi:hypothetical protein